PDNPEEKREGAFYVWTADEIERLLGKERAAIFNDYYGVQPEGNVSEDPHGAFVGKNILYVAHTVEDVARHFGKSTEEIERLLAEARTRLRAARQQRPRPHLDDKILVSWNGLMISAFARAYQVLGEPAYLQAARKAATFILTTLYDSKTGRLLRRYRAGEARFDAHLEDYAFLVMALLDLYEADLDIRWLQQAVQLTERQIRLFYDEKEGGFFDTAPSDTLLVRTKEGYDGAEPSGNSIATLNLLRLSEMLDRAQWRRMAEKTLTLFGERLQQQPQSLPQMLVALDFYLDTPRQIIIAGKRQGADTRRLLGVIYQRYLPNSVLLLADGAAGQEYFSQRIPFFKQVKMIDGKATAYICQNFACQLPTTDPQTVAKLLEEEKRPSRQPQ
ncbi:MAG: thioredoxin domain-containing protein, partial [Acidobacteria bacterium]